MGFSQIGGFFSDLLMSSSAFNTTG